MPIARQLFTDQIDNTCLDCIYLQDKVADLEQDITHLQRMLTLLTLQVSAMKQDIFGDGLLVALDKNGDPSPEDR